MFNVKILSMVIAGVMLSFLAVGLKPAYSEQKAEFCKQEPLDFLVVKPDTPRPVDEQGDNKFRFLGLESENNGQYSEYEITIPLGGRLASNYNNHKSQAFLVLDGNLTIELKDQTLDAKSGTFVYLPKDKPYLFKNTGNKQSKLLGFSFFRRDTRKFVLTSGNSVSNSSEPSFDLRATSTDKVNGSQLFPSYKEILVVSSGAPDRPTYDVLGERFTLLAIGKETRDQFSLIEVLSPAGSGAPLRINFDVDETFFIEEGELTFQLEDKSVVAPAGSLVYLPRGRAQGYVNTGGKTAKFVSLITPGGELENFFPEAGQLVTDRSTSVATPSQDTQRIGTIAAKYGVQVLPSNSDITSAGGLSIRCNASH